MWPFSRHYSLDDIGFLKGAVDCHSHILPGVDDGVRTLEKALAALSYFEEAGVKEVWFTPHVMEDYPNKTQDLRQGFDALCAAYNGPLALHLSAENMLDALFEQRLSDGDLLTMGENQVLVETSFFYPPMCMEETLDRILCHGYFPILAHPERYYYMMRRDYERFKKMGVKFQLSIMSLSGLYGIEAAMKARQLLRAGMYDYWGSDLHHLTVFRRTLAAKVLRRKDVKALLELKRNTL